MTDLIYDANNWLRRRFEAGASVRLCYAEVLANPGAIVFDGMHAKRRRKDVFPGYKERRVLPGENIFKQFDLFKETCAWLPVPLICVPYWEADDVIATLVRAAAPNHIKIKSTDVDFAQLQNASIEEFMHLPTEPNRIRLYKTVVGDASDAIPGMKVFGKGSWAKLDDKQRQELEDFVSGKKQDIPLFLPKATINWLTAENQKLVRDFWRITALYDVPMKEILDNTKFGVRDPDSLDANLSRFML